MKTILIIEDNQEVRENTAEILELAHYRVLTAENGKQGVDLALREQPDLIVCDIMMPALDGYGVLHMLSRNPKTATIPFIFLTAKTDKADMRKGMELGADDYLTKPFSEHELLQAIETRLRKAEMAVRPIAGGKQGIQEFLNQASALRGDQLIHSDREVREYKKRQTIFEAGQRPHYLYYLNKGTVKLYRQNEDGKEYITHLLTPGEFFGVVALLEDKPYDESAETLEEAEVMLIPRQEFQQLIYADASISRTFIHLLASKLADKEEELLRLAYNSVRKRVADALLLIYDRSRASDTDRPALSISRDDLAHIAGTATESLIRTLSDFKSEKLIEVKDNKIHILNENKLRRMLN
ncbi:MAG: response regulator [Chitinophagales bacterium]|nr:response regulator [Chitinophagales bacterium]MDW8393457.1 response regulator [Chitinophagales bacterium]